MAKRNAAKTASRAAAPQNAPSAGITIKPGLWNRIQRTASQLNDLVAQVGQPSATSKPPAKARSSKPKAMAAGQSQTND
jgi:hypothetical protein